MERPRLLAFLLGCRCPGHSIDASAGLPAIATERADLRSTRQGVVPEEGDLTTIVSRFTDRAALAPSAIAVTAGGESLSYADLDARSNALARRLVAAGAGPGSLVGVALPRSVDLVAALLAVLKSGAAYLPLDPTYPKARLDYLVSDAKPVSIVTAAGIHVPDAGVPRIDLSSADSGDATALGDDERSSPLDPEHPAYVIYTSGSTGLPKGVVVPHRCFLALLDAAAPILDLTSSDVWSVFHSYAFDVSVWEIWGSLLTGGRAVIVPAEATWSAPELLALLDAERVTILSQTPSAFAALDRADAEAAVPMEALRAVLFAGEALDPARLSAWFGRRGPHPRMVNLYGITETTVHVTTFDVTPGTRGIAGESPIGRPVPGFRQHVLDARLEPVADGEAGELFLGGGQLARGYLARPGLTAARFVADPDGQGARLYRSGDIVRRMGDDLAFIGRADTQLSLRGFRIEPGEVEAALEAGTGVSASAVAVKPDPDGAAGDDCLVGYVVTASGSIDERGLRAHLARTLPAHLVPSHLVPLTALPLTPNGKLDRSALIAPPPRKSADATRSRALLRRRLARNIAKHPLAMRESIEP